MTHEYFEYLCKLERGGLRLRKPGEGGFTYGCTLKSHAKYPLVTCKLDISGHMSTYVSTSRVGADISGHMSTYVTYVHLCPLMFAPASKFGRFPKNNHISRHMSHLIVKVITSHAKADLSRHMSTYVHICRCHL